MRRAALFLLALLVAFVAAGSAPAAAAVPPGARVYSLADTYRPTSDGLRFHASGATFNLCEGAKGGGKTRAICGEIVRLLMEFNGNRLMMFRQKYDDLVKTTLPSFLAVCPPDYIREHRKTDRVYVFQNKSELLYGGLSGNILQSEPAIQHYVDGLKSLELGGFYLHEGSQSRKVFWDALKQTLRFIPPGTDPHRMRYRGFVDSNPEPGWVHKAFIRGPLPRDHARWTFFPTNNFGLAPGYFDRFSDMPESWKRRYILGQWDFDQEGDSWVYPLAIVERAFELDLPEDASEPARYGLDPAGQGADHACLCRQRGPRFSLWSWPKTTGPELAWNIEDVTRKHGRAPINYDAGGLGAPVGEGLGVRSLYRDGQTTVAAHQVVKVSTARQALKKEKYADRRTEMFFALRERMREGRACFAGDEPTLARLREQMMALQFEADANGRPKVEAKKVFKARTGMSPDELEAVVYANSAPRHMTIGAQG